MVDFVYQDYLTQIYSYLSKSSLDLSHMVAFTLLLRTLFD